MIHYFHKIGFNSPLKIGAKLIQFEPIGGNAGVKVLSDDRPDQKEEIAFLNQCADRQLRGVTRISAEIYAQKKSSHPSMTSRNLRGSSHEGVRIFDRNELSLLPKKAAVASPAAEGSGPVILQQAMQNPDGSPGTPINIAVGAQQQPRPFTPAVRKVTPNAVK